MIPSTFFRKKFTAAPPKEWSWIRRQLTFLEGPLIMLNLLTYSFFPWLHAQTMMLFGRKFKNLYHTPKVR